MGMPRTSMQGSSFNELDEYLLNSQTVMRQQTFQQAPEKKAVQPKKKTMFDINDQVSIVRRWWNQIQPADSLLKDAEFVSRKLVDKKIFMDASSA